jgi:phospholipase D1/2
VQRHPDHAVGGTFFWSHHEKFVVVDNRIAFLGGIDLCYGKKKKKKKKKKVLLKYLILILIHHRRWDTHAHRLADFTYPDPHLEIYRGTNESYPLLYLLIV